MKFTLFILLVSLSLVSCSKSSMELDGDFAEALELLDEAIDEFPDRLQETFDEIDLIGKELAYAADDRRRMECCERLSDEYINVSVDSVSIYAERMLGYAQTLSDPDGIATALMYLSSVAQMKEDYLGSINRLNSISLEGVSGETLKQYHERAESVYYSLFIRSFNSPNDRYLNHTKEYYRQKLNENRSAYLSIDSTSCKATMIRISELRDDKRPSLFWNSLRIRCLPKGFRRYGIVIIPCWMPSLKILTGRCSTLLWHLCMTFVSLPEILCH